MNQNKYPPKCCDCKHFYAPSMAPVAFCTHQNNSSLVGQFSAVLDERNDLTGNCMRAGYLFEAKPPKKPSLWQRMLRKEAA